MKREQHRMTNTAEYRAWTEMKTRCYNKSRVFYKNYGGRGIRVCDRWLHSFTAFLADMGQRPTPEHSLDRIDVDGDYTPKNCRWASLREQANNKRTTVRIDGSPIAEVARSTGIKRGTLNYRVKHGKHRYPPNQPQVITLTFRGVTDSVSGWSGRTGIKASTLAMRITHYRWPVEKALTKGAIKCAY